jgi:putative tryptophan/tyrosine transport system substrate-binding protein
VKRREFIAGLAGAAAWPLAARAQQPAMAVIGYLSASSANTTITLKPFLEGLKESGFVEGRNVNIEYRFAEGQYDLLPALAADLVRRKVVIIQATGGPFVTAAAKAATSTIPIVFQGGGEDPVKAGLVASLNRPGGNVTGLTNLSGPPLGQKQVEILRELLPTNSLLGLLVNRSNPSAEVQLNGAREAARALRWEFHVEYASTEVDLEAAFANLAQRRIGALVVIGDSFFSSHRAQIVGLAARYAIPASYFFREFVVEGGLMSYGADLTETNRIAGTYVGRILKGEKPADLPVYQATKVGLAINIKTAKALGLTLPTALLVRSDEVIEREGATSSLGSGAWRCQWWRGRSRATACGASACL